MTAQERVYKKRDKRRYLKLTHDGTSCICEPHEGEQMVKDDPSLAVSEVWMTAAQFEALPEFQGY
jgi:hypothetical protein